MLEIGIVPINLFGCGFYRLFIPLRKMEHICKDYHVEGIFTHSCSGIELNEISLLKTFIENKDVITIQRRYGEQWENFSNLCKERGKIVVYEIDDCFEGIPLENLKLDAIHMTKPETRHSVIRMMNIADAVTVSTPELKEWVCRYADRSKVHCLKNTLDFSMWPKPHYGSHIEGDPLVVGFAGAESHKTDLRELGGSLFTLNNQFNMDSIHKVMFGFFGFMLQEFWSMQPHVCFKLGVPFLEYPNMLSKLHFNIGLAPLKQCLFNECKSELRFMEHAVCGVPIVATDIAPFRRCVNDQNGILVKNNSRHWVRAVRSIIMDDQVRHDMGVNSFEYAAKNYNIDTYVTEWNKLYKTFIK